VLYPLSYEGRGRRGAAGVSVTGARRATRRLPAPLTGPGQDSLGYEALKAWSVFVVVITVGRVTAPVVHVVDVIAMRDGHVTAPLTVNVVMALMYYVTAVGFAFVKVIVVAAVKMAVVRIVDVIAMRDRDMPAPFAVSVIMAEMLVMSGSVHCSSSTFGPTTMALRPSC
jgi:hypothetical protein